MEDFKNFTPFEEPEEGLEEYMASFIEGRKKDAKEIRDFYQRGDAESVKKILHKWEGFAEPYGFGGLRTFSGQIRTSLKLQKSALFEKIYTQLLAYLSYKEKMLGQNS